MHISKLTNINHSLIWTLVYGLIITLIILRMLIFVNKHGGIEYDSGWCLDIAKNLAQQGKYATGMNPIKYEGYGVHESVWGRFSVQDNQGLVYFPSASSVGISYMLPQALIIKLLGFDYWQIRLWPMVSYTLLIVVLTYISYLIGGFFAPIFFLVWIWFFPQFSINFFFEAFSEQIATLFIALMFLSINRFIKNMTMTWIIFTGLFMGLAISTKILTLLYLPVSLVLLIIQYRCLKKENMLKTLIFSFIICSLSFLPLYIFNHYKTSYMIKNFGLKGLEAIKKEFQLHLINEGSGLQTLKKLINSPAERSKILADIWFRFKQKTHIWGDYFGLPYARIYWFICMILIPLFLVTFSKNKFLSSLLIFAPIPHWLWFLILSDNAWGRHIWFGLIFCIVTYSSTIGLTINLLKSNKLKGLLIKAILIVVIVPFLFFFISSKRNPNWLLTIDWLNNEHMSFEGKFNFGFPSLYIFDLKPQREAANFIKQNTSLGKDKLIVEPIYFAPEIVALTNRGTLLLERLINNYDKYKNNNNYLIYGPHLHGPYKRKYGAGTIENAIKRYCGEEIFSNNAYFICRISNHKIQSLTNNL